MSWKTSESILALPIDQYTRQAWASEMVEYLDIRKKSTKLKILDVGGYKGKTKEFFPDDDVTVCDLFEVDSPNYVRTDGSRLPFDDSSFDIVVTFDAYEHVPRKQRPKFIDEMIRVTTEGVVLAAPFDNSQRSVSDSEVRVNDFHKNLYDKDHPWLKEHIDYRIPEFAELKKYLEEKEVRYSYINSNHLDVWTVFQTLYLSIDLDDDLRGRVDDVNRRYNKSMKTLDIARDNDSYRKIVFFSNNTKNVDTVSKEIKKLSVGSASKSTSLSIADAMNVYGRKYADAIRHNEYLSIELDAMKKTLSVSQQRLTKIEKESVVGYVKRSAARAARQFK